MCLCFLKHCSFHQFLPKEKMTGLFDDCMSSAPTTGPVLLRQHVSQRKSQGAGEVAEYATSKQVKQKWQRFSSPVVRR
jgi:hypothetical protein